jgi:hypothetical protein
MSPQRLTLTVVLALALAGCGSGPKVAPVSGTILLDGEPMVGASVNTQPIASSSSVDPGPGSFGKTDAEGRYTLELIDPPIAGAVLGTHRVTITPADTQPYRSSDEPVKPQGDPWPARYSDGSLRLMVPAEGNTEANYELTLK